MTLSDRRSRILEAISVFMEEDPEEALTDIAAVATAMLLRYRPKDRLFVLDAFVQRLHETYTVTVTDNPCSDQAPQSQH